MRREAYLLGQVSVASNQGVATISISSECSIKCHVCICLIQVTVTDGTMQSVHVVIYVKECNLPQTMWLALE